ncbi:hypothetical protein BLA29_010543 [Euroglyphus maynei]|uniref:Uncharacterized protein n=1 Tax=Euroglyphus maynei TaxID=6958 RepID=A0A1Y3ASA5_EURMA|nr:hypothetical protein BLA29_010543 [Euroglyphus maynei]
MCAQVETKKNNNNNNRNHCDRYDDCCGEKCEHSERKHGPLYGGCGGKVKIRHATQQLGVVFAEIHRILVGIVESSAVAIGDEVME